MSEATADLLHNPAATGALGVIVTAAASWLGQRLLGKAAIQDAINKSFHELMEQLRQELRVALKERDDARAENVEHRAKVEELQAAIAALERHMASCQCP